MIIHDFGNALIKVITENNFQEIATHLGDKVSGKLTKDTPFSELDPVSLVINSIKHINSLKESSFNNKIYRFLNQLNDIPEEDRTKFRQKLDSNPKLNQKVGEIVVLTLDHTDRLEKADLIGIIFRHYITGNLENKMALRLISIIDRCFLEDFVSLFVFSNTNEIINNGKSTDVSSIEHLFTLGLLNNGGIDGGGPDGDGGIRYLITEVGEAMLNIVFKESGMYEILNDLKQN